MSLELDDTERERRAVYLALRLRGLDRKGNTVVRYRRREVARVGSQVFRKRPENLMWDTRWARGKR